MNSKTGFSAKRVIDTVLNLLCQDRMQREIDEPVDTAKQNFNVTESEPITHSAFNRVIAVFIRHVYREGLRLPMQLSDQEALAEAIFLLERYYPRENTEGYEEALIEANAHGQAGLEFVMTQLAESIKTVERKKYVRWVYAVNFEHLDWQLRCRIAAAYIDQNKQLVPGHLQDPDRMAGSLRDLIEFNWTVDDEIRQIVITIFYAIIDELVN